MTYSLYIQTAPNQAIIAPLPAGYTIDKARIVASLEYKVRREHGRPIIAVSIHHNHLEIDSVNDLGWASEGRDDNLLLDPAFDEADF